MKNNKRMFFAIIGAIIISILVNVFIIHSVNAATLSPDQLYKISVFQGVRHCFDDVAYNEVYLRNFNQYGYQALFMNKDATISSNFNKDGKVIVTTNVGNTLGDSDLKCSEVFTGYNVNKSSNSGKGLLNYYPILPTDLGKYGYIFSRNEGASDKETGDPTRMADNVRIEINSIKDNSGNNPNNPVKASGSIDCSGEQTDKSSKYYWTVQECTGAITMTYTANGVTRTLIKVTADGGTTLTASRDYSTYSLGDDMPGWSTLLTNRLGAKLQNSDKSQQAFYQALKNTANSESGFGFALWSLFMRAAGEIYADGGDYSVDISYTPSAPSSSGISDLSSIYAPFANKKSWAADIFFYNLGIDNSLTHTSGTYSFGGQSANMVQYVWNPDSTYALYYTYLKNMQKQPEYSGLEINCNAGSQDGGKYTVKVSADRWCYVNLGSNAYNIENERVALVKDPYTLEMGNFSEALAWLTDSKSYNNMHSTAYADEEVGSDGVVDNGVDNNISSSTSSDEGEAVCRQNARVVGWILCPIIKAISGIGEHMWNQVEQNHLKIPATQIFVDNDGVKKAFDIVKNISNVVFIILFMVVIFSQLTGVGIDNYGIKRILPKLILVAILSNLSYYICEIAIDLSNIFGNGLNNLLTSFANDIGYGSDSLGALASGLAIDSLLGAGALTIFLTLNPITATGAVMGAISVAFAVFGIIVAIVAAMLVLYLIVVIREAGIIIAVILAPVAIVCYVLPNTEKLYKRWFDIFKALLIVYPICGAMVGAGKLAGAVLGQINTQSMAVAAMIVQVIPFFLIPMLLKNSLSALGNIGAKISNAGRSLSRRTSGAITGGIKNSARFKDFEQFQKDKITAERAGRVAKALERRARKRGGVENLSLRDQDRLAKAHAIQEQRRAYERRTEMGAREDYHEFREKNMDAAFDSERGKMYAQNFEYETDRNNLKDAFDSGIDGDDAEYAVAAMEALINRGGIKEALDVVRGKKKFDWDSDMGKRLAQAMGGTNVDAFQAYSKYRGKGGKVGFDDWLKGADHGNKNIKEVSSYADHLRARGIKSMAKYSKDEMEFIKNNYSAISAGMGATEREEFRGDLAGMVNWAAINSDDAKVSRMAEQVLTQELTYGTEDVSGNKTYGISSVRDLGLTAGSIGQMKGTTMKAILSGYEQRIASNEQYASLGQEKITELAMQALRNDLAPQIKAIESDVRIKNNTSGDVLSILGISGGPNDIPDTSVPLRQEAPTPKPNNNPAPSSNDGWYFDNYGGGSKT